MTSSAAWLRMARNGIHTKTQDNRDGVSSVWTTPLVALVTFLEGKSSRNVDVEVYPAGSRVS